MGDPVLYANFFSRRDLCGGCRVTGIPTATISFFIYINLSN